MDFLERIAEEKIKEAIERGELDHLPGMGKPLKLEDLSRVPEELRAGYILLKNAGILPEEIELKKELITLRELIDSCTNDDEKRKLTKEWTEKKLRFHLLMEKRGRSIALEEYEEKIEKRLND